MGVASDRVLPVFRAWLSWFCSFLQRVCIISIKNLGLVRRKLAWQTSSTPPCLAWKSLYYRQFSFGYVWLQFQVGFPSWRLSGAARSREQDSFWCKKMFNIWPIFTPYGHHARWPPKNFINLWVIPCAGGRPQYEVRLFLEAETAVGFISDRMSAFLARKHFNISTFLPCTRWSTSRHRNSKGRIYQQLLSAFAAFVWDNRLLQMLQ